MRTTSLALLALLLLATAAAPSRAQTGEVPRVDPTQAPLPNLPAADAEAVRAALQGYLAAIRRHDGPAATQAVTRATRAYYAQMRDLAMTAPEAQVRALPLMDRVSVLMYRHRVPADVLRTLAGDAAFAHTISAGWVDRTANWQPSAAVEVFGSGDQAYVRDGEMVAQFVREEGAWRWDMMPIIRAASAQVAARLPAGMKEDDFVMLVLTSTSGGRPVPPTIWQPVQ